MALVQSSTVPHVSTGGWQRDYAVRLVTRLPAWLLVVLPLIAASCATLEQLTAGAFQKPTLAYKSATLADVSLSGATLNLVTTVNNPNGTPVGVVRLPLSHQGTFELPDMPGIALGTPRLTKVGIDQATVELPLTLTAKGSYPVPLQALQAAVSVDGTRVGEVSAKDLGTLEPGTSRAVSLPLTIPFSGALQAAQAIIRGAASRSRSTVSSVRVQCRYPSP